jgi:Icc-related predicted phosphoesterase
VSAPIVPQPIRIFALSDIHLEFAHLEPVPDARPDLVVLAGDIGRGTDAITWAEYYFPDIPVVFVIGNHELYRDSLELLLEDCRSGAATTRNVRFLENEQIVIPLRDRDVRVLGTCLWTDFKLNGANRQAESMLIAQRNLADYRLIEYKGTRLLPSDTCAFHEVAVTWLDRMLAEPHEGPTIVLTHHAPSPGSVPPFYRGSLLSPAFNSDLEPLILRHQPELWIHGHTHWSVDYTVGRTRVYSNQRGYPGEETGFSMRCITL